MEAWRNLRKRVLGIQDDYANLSPAQLSQYRLRLGQVVERSERLGFAQNYIAQTARKEAQRIALLAMERLNADHAQINVITKNDQVTVASTDVAVDAPNTVQPREGSWCQHVVGTGDVLAIEDGSRHAMVKHTEAAVTGQVVSYLGHPIRVGGEVIGALCVFDDQERAWTDDDVRMLAQLAEAAGDAGRVSAWTRSS
jgi:GAF domain-containing protein